MLRLFAAAFWCFGVLIVLVGANQAELAHALNLDLAASGLLGAALALGALLGITGAGPLFDRFARRPLFVCGVLTSALALLSVSATMSYAGAVVRIALAGFGAGAYNTVVNASVAERYGDASARPMAVIHGMATLGAVVGAPLSGYIAGYDWTLSFRGLGAIFLAVALAGSLTSWRAAPRDQPSAPIDHRALAPYLAMAFGYVGLEAVSTIFAVPYAQHALQLEPARGRYAISALWFGIFLSRCGMYVLRPTTHRAIAWAGSATAIVLALGIGTQLRVIELLHFGVGLGIGTVYPLLMVLLGVRFGRARGTAQGLAGGAGALGGFFVPWLTGVTGDHFGIDVAMASLTVWALTIALAGVWAGRRAARS